MGKALGVLMLGASLSAAVYGWMSLEEAMDQGPVALVVASTADVAAVPEPRVISSNRSLAAIQGQPVAPKAAPGAGDGQSSGGLTEAPPPAGARPTSFEPQKLAQADTKSQADIKGQALPTPAPVIVPLPQAANEEARRALARDIQKELKRVGCYDGDIDGQWNTTTRKAMGAFNERVNASLPTEGPDFILLTLVQGHAARACGRICPAGQALTNDNRCLPRALISKAPAARQPTATEAGAAVASAPEVKRPKVALAPLPGRMTVGAPAEAVVVNDKALKEADARRKAEQAAIEARRARLEAERKTRIDAEQKSVVATDAVKSAELASLEERRARLEAERKARIAFGVGPASGQAPAVMSALGGPPRAVVPAPAAQPAPVATATVTAQGNTDADADQAADAASAAAARVAAVRAQAAARAARLQRERNAARRYVSAPYSPPMYVTRPQVRRPAVTIYPRRSVGAVFNSLSRSAP